MWNGDFTGRTFAHIHATVATSGRMSATYKEMLVGTYMGDCAVVSFRNVD